MSYEYNDTTNMVELFREIARDEFAQLMKKENIEKCYNGVVKSVSSDNKTATVELSFMTTGLIPNLTGKTLSIGNHVKLFSEMITLGDAYIGVQMDEYTAV